MNILKMLLKVAIFVFVITRVTGGRIGNHVGFKRLCSEKSMPDFPGRISERKCEQYLWEKKERIRKEKCAKPKWGVFNGISSNITEYPHMAAIGWQSIDGGWSFECGGSLISHHFVLTAAHCTKSKIKGIPKIVRLGATCVREDKPDSADKPIDIEIKRILKHPKYISPKKRYDITLLELSEKVNFTMFVQPACLSTEPEVDATKNYFVSGWGQLYYGGPSSKELQSAEVKVVENCKIYEKLYRNRNWNGLEDHQLCAGDGTADTCQGDSGGPLQLKNSKTGHDMDLIYTIVAITSFGKECGITNDPAIYTKVFNFIDWIEEHVWPETSKTTENLTVNDNKNGKLIGRNFFVRIIPVAKKILDNYLKPQSKYEDDRPNSNEINLLVRVVPTGDQNTDDVELELNIDNEKNHTIISKASKEEWKNIKNVKEEIENHDEKGSNGGVSNSKDRIIFSDEIL